MVAGPYTADRLAWRAAQLAAQRATLENATLEFHQYIARIGGAGLQDAGFPPDQATEFARVADVMGTLPAIYYGDAGQTPPYNFHDALTAWRGPGIAT